MKRFKLYLLALLLTLSVFFMLGCDEGEIESPTVAVSDQSHFEVHFIDVGQADAALVMCDGENMLIDAGNTADSSLIYTYLKKHGVKSLDYVIASHIHEDHIGGMSGALAYAKPGRVFCPVTYSDNEFFLDLSSSAEKHGAVIEVPNVSDSFELGSARVDIIACNTTDVVNSTSIVLKVSYGETSFLFTGDIERDAENIILDGGADLDADVLKVSHHGSNSSTSYRFLREVMPEYAVISCEKNNEYGHPHDEVLSRLEDADATVLRTDEMGDIVFKSDGKKVTFTNDTTDSSAEADYILNTGSGKFHLPECENAIKISQKNKTGFEGTRDELIAMGYLPSGCCKP